MAKITVFYQYKGYGYDDTVHQQVVNMPPRKTLTIGDIKRTPEKITFEFEKPTVSILKVIVEI